MISSVVNEIDGIALSGLNNAAYEVNGIQTALLRNRATIAKGLRIGLVNKAKRDTIRIMEYKRAAKTFVYQLAICFRRSIPVTAIRSFKTRQITFQGFTIPVSGVGRGFIGRLHKVK